MLETRQELLAIDWASDELPTLPSIAHRLLSMVGNDTVEPMELAELIGQDPTLTIRLLKAVNSAYYALNMEITSIRHATVLLGMSEVKHIALGAVMTERFLTVPMEVRPLAKKLWHHMLAVAMVAQDLSQGVEEEPDLYTLGLLHDIGWLVLLAQAPQVYISMTEETDLTRDLTEASWGVDHQLWGSKLAEKWELPEPFQVVTLRHHAPMDKFTPPRYLAIISLANYLVNSMDMGIFRLSPEPPDDGLLKVLSLDWETLQEMETAYMKDRSRLESLFSVLTG